MVICGVELFAEGVSVGVSLTTVSVSIGVAVVVAVKAGTFVGFSTVGSRTFVGAVIVSFMAIFVGKPSGIFGWTTMPAAIFFPSGSLLGAMMVTYEPIFNVSASSGGS